MCSLMERNHFGHVIVKHIKIMIILGENLAFQKDFNLPF